MEITDCEKTNKSVLAAAVVTVCLILVAVALAGYGVVNIHENQPYLTKPFVQGNYEKSDNVAARHLLQYNSPVSTQAGKQIYTIAVGHDYGAHEYIDDQGYLAGFTMDFVQAVCQAAQMDCRTMWEPYTNCYDSEPVVMDSNTGTTGQAQHAGEGIISGWYDACATWSKTVARTNSLLFSKAFLKPLMSTWWIKKNGAMTVSQVPSKKIGFVDGWSSDEKCMARALKSLNGRFEEPDKVEDTYIHFKTPMELVDAISSGAVEAGFGGMQDLGNPEYEDKIKPLSTGSRFSCKLDGNGMIARKDNNDFITKFDRGFDKILENGVYKRICDQANKIHAKKGKVTCIDT